MTLETWIAFCVTAAVASLVPGPAVLLVVSMAVSRGARAGMAASLGILAMNIVFFAISAYMTLKGLFAVWRTVGLDPLRFDVSAIGAKTSDVPTILAALSAGSAITLWFPFAFAAAIVVWV